MQRCSKSLPLNSFVLPVAILLVARNLRTRLRPEHPHHGLALRTIGIVVLTLVVMCGARPAIAAHSVARVWNEQLLDAISIDTARRFMRGICFTYRWLCTMPGRRTTIRHSSICITNAHGGGH